MKPFVQILRNFRTRPGWLLFMAVVVVAALTFSAQAHADPSQGAIVMHIDRDRAGWFEAESSDGQLRLDVVLSGQRDFLRLNPDGTLTVEHVESKAPITVSILGNDGNWVQLWVGSGSFHHIALAWARGRRLVLRY